MSFIGTLSITDLTRLREIVKKVHMKNWPGRFQTLEQIDKIINAMGEKTLEAFLKRGIDSGIVEKKIYIGESLAQGKKIAR